MSIVIREVAVPYSDIWAIDAIDLCTSTTSSTAKLPSRILCLLIANISIIITQPTYYHSSFPIYRHITTSCTLILEWIYPNDPYNQLEL